MKKTILRLGSLALGLGIIGMSASTVLAYRGDPAIKGPNYSTERHEAMEKAFENKDYDAWKSLMAGKGKVIQVINKDNFARFAEAHALAKQGEIEEARKIRQELGLGLRNGFGKASGEKGMHKYKDANR